MGCWDGVGEKSNVVASLSMCGGEGSRVASQSPEGSRVAPLSPEGSRVASLSSEGGGGEVWCLCCGVEEDKIVKTGRKVGGVEKVKKKGKKNARVL